MNNKAKGTRFEQEWCDYLIKQGYYAHRIVPQKNGSQPCDIFAAKDGLLYAYDCKVLVGDRFPLSRIEWNQRYGFARMGTIGGVKRQFIVIKQVDKAEKQIAIYQIPYMLLIDKLVGEVPSINVNDYEEYRIK